MLQMFAVLILINAVHCAKRTLADVKYIRTKGLKKSTEKGNKHSGRHRKVGIEKHNSGPREPYPWPCRDSRTFLLASVQPSGIVFPVCAM